MDERKERKKQKGKKSVINGKATLRMFLYFA